MLLSSHLVREARRASGLTQAQLASRLGTSQPEIARLESGRVNPRLSTIRRAIEATGHVVEVELRPTDASVDETMVAANLKLSPRERLERFASAYQGIASLTASSRAANGP
jgi:predicted transcriptional regulator